PAAAGATRCPASPSLRCPATRRPSGRASPRLPRRPWSRRAPGMNERLKELEERYEELTRQLMDPAVAADGRRYQQVARAQAELRPLIEHLQEGRRLEREAEEARQVA